MSSIHDAALTALAAGRAKARELEMPSTYAIVDAGGNLVAFLRDEAAGLATIEIARAKAYTAVALRSPSGDWMDLVQPSAALYGLEQLGGRERLVVFGGGLPVFVDGRLVAGVGVSGGPVDIDVAIARSMVESLCAAGA
ncbi:heme-binding protein [Gemmobacter sp.]|uniref:GlcG/HbpS family heme-binding protein n=1 Tax=Gemmobacter sp. TaxID=1898957 RepID=UPI002AFF21CA|nr:heme-binding protein [Gemmobacter sp.]